MAAFDPSIIGNDDAYDSKFQIVSTCGIIWEEYLINEDILTREVFEKNIHRILKTINCSDHITYQVLGALALRTGSYLPSDIKRLIINACNIEHDDINWGRKFGIREIYLRDLREKIVNHTDGIRSYLIRLQIDCDDDIKFTSIGIDELNYLIMNKEYDNIKHINLDSCNLYQPPIQLSNFNNLISLSLNNNYLESFDLDAEYLRSLEYLSLRNNLLELIPEDISGFYNLKFLDLSRNKLRRFPLNLVKRSNTLRHLYISGNPIRNFPDNLPFKLKISDSDLLKRQFFSFYN